MTDYLDYEFNHFDLEKGILSPLPNGLIADVLGFLLLCIFQDDGLAPRTTFLGMSLRVRM